MSLPNSLWILTWEREANRISDWSLSMSCHFSCRTTWARFSARCRWVCRRSSSSSSTRTPGTAPRPGPSFRSATSGKWSSAVSCNKENISRGGKLFLLLERVVIWKVVSKVLSNSRSERERERKTFEFCTHPSLTWDHSKKKAKCGLLNLIFRIYSVLGVEYWKDVLEVYF